jgi:hypothetical protein
MLWLVAGGGLLLLAGLSALVLLAASSFGGQSLDRASCRPRNLLRLDTCWGNDESWQECRFYYAAAGVPDAFFCKSLVARPKADGAGTGACELASPRGWREVECARYALATWPRCFACNVGEQEAAHSYVYAYDAACTATLQIVTCNFEPRRAGQLLKDSRPDP